MIVLKRNPNYAVCRDGSVFSLKNGMLSPKRNWDGYLRVQLWNHGKCEFVAIHRLVAQTYIPNPDNKPFVNHINGIKSDNRVSNLEWCTQKQNIRHAWDTGLAHTHLNRSGKPVRQYAKDGRFIKEWPSAMQVQRVLGIPHGLLKQSQDRGGTAGGYRWEVVR